MKNLICAIIILLFTMTANAQEDNDFFEKVHEFKIGLSLTEVNFDGSRVANAKPQNILPGYQFKALSKVGTDYIIQFLEWPAGDARNQQLVDKSNSGHKQSTANDQPVYFRLSQALYASNCEVALSKHSITVGALTLPIKMRFGAKSADGTYARDFSFSGDISLGFSVGYKYAPNKKYAHNILTGISLTSVPVSPASTNNFLKTETNLSAITWHLGYLFEIDNFQFGVFAGYDYLAGEAGRSWVYKDKPWLGIGFGYSILNKKKTTDKQ